MFDFSRVPPFDADGNLHAIIETPRGHQNKFNFDEKLGLFVLGGTLPAGHTFPYDFGFVPQTRAADGDPLDVLVLMDDAAFAGCVVTCRLVGAIEALQEKHDSRMRNDRLIAVWIKSHQWNHVRSIDDFTEIQISEMEHFFVSYNGFKEKQFTVVRRAGVSEARKLVENARQTSVRSRSVEKAGATSTPSSEE